MAKALSVGVRHRLRERYVQLPQSPFKGRHFDSMSCFKSFGAGPSQDLIMPETFVKSGSQVSSESKLTQVKNKLKLKSLSS